MDTSSNDGFAIDRIDHVVLLTTDLARTTTFYAEVLGMRPVHYGEGRTALEFGRSKINVHEIGRKYDPVAHQPTAGSADLCLITDGSLDSVQRHLSARSVPIELGPVVRTGALGAMASLYIRDPDRNLIEIATYEPADVSAVIGSQWHR